MSQGFRFIYLSTDNKEANKLIQMKGLNLFVKKMFNLITTCSNWTLKTSQLKQPPYYMVITSAVWFLGVVEAFFYF